MSSAASPLLEALGAFPLAGAAEDARALMDGVLRDGLPTQRVEAWKYTSLRPLSARRFVPPADAVTADIDAGAFADVPAPRLVFVNGVFAAAASDLGHLPDGAFFGIDADLAHADASGPDGPARPTGDDGADSVFGRLNDALATTGVVLSLAAGMRLEAPLHVVFAGAPATADLALHLRHRIQLGAGAQATLVEHHRSLGAHRHLANHRTRIALADGARLVHARAQDEDAGATLFAATDATLHDDAAYQRLDLELGAAMSRHELTVRLAGDRARVDAGGALLATGRRQVDTRLDVRHVARDTQCALLWRGLASDRGRVSFHGGIRIAAGADGAAASLSSKNLLLSEQAEVNTQPVLEIDADEVQAAHGATVGRLDPGALFYLRSRGLPYDEARALLTLAFCREALAALGDDRVAALLSPRLEARLRDLGELGDLAP